MEKCYTVRTYHGQEKHAKTETLTQFSRSFAPLVDKKSKKMDLKTSLIKNVKYEYENEKKNSFFQRINV